MVVIIIIATTGKANAEPVTENKTFSQIINNDPFKNQQFILDILKPKPPKPIEYVVVEGDNLSKIANKNNTTWQRLWQKNTQLDNQDVLDVGSTLVIPTKDEVLTDRPIKYQELSNEGSYVVTGGNLYEPGQCVWYVKNRRPDIPNTWHNATTWYYYAQQDGWAVGSVPKAGAVGWYYGHVVYVESVLGDGQILISEMNYDYVPYHQRTVVANASTYLYIY